MEKETSHTATGERERESAFFALSLSSKTDGSKSFVVFFFFFFCQRANSTEVEAKKFQKFHSHAPINFFRSLPFFSGKLERNLPHNTQSKTHTHTRFFFLVRAPFVCFARDTYKKRETTHLAWWIRRLNENGPLQKASRSLEHSLFIVSKSRLKIQKQREREGFY